MALIAFLPGINVGGHRKRSIPGEHATALRESFSKPLAQKTVFRAIAEEITNVDIWYEMAGDGGDHHPLLGRWPPNLTLLNENGTIRFAELMRAGKGILLDLAGTGSATSGGVKMGRSSRHHYNPL
jgi:hypothetical protein